jgi:hypothetical protein
MLATYLVNNAVLLVLFNFDFIDDKDFVVAAIILAATYFVISFYMRPQKIKGLPFLPSNSILGYSKTFLPESNVHEIFLENANNVGAIYTVKIKNLFIRIIKNF